MKKILPVAFLAAVAVACSRAPATSAEAPAPRPERAARATMDVPPAPEQPSVRTHPLSRDALNDTVITGRIKAAILSDPGMAGADVSVNTDKGVVVLAGVVKSQEQTAIASAHAQRQDGVMRVDNHLALALE